MICLKDALVILLYPSRAMRSKISLSSFVSRSSKLMMAFRFLRERMARWNRVVERFLVAAASEPGAPEEALAAAAAAIPFVSIASKLDACMAFTATLARALRE